MSARTKLRASWPAALAVATAGGVAALGAVVSCGDDKITPPVACDAGVCPSDGRVCLTPDTFEACCPLCPVDGQCGDGCVLSLPPV